MSKYTINQTVYAIRDDRIAEVMECKIISATLSSKGITYSLFDVDRNKKYDIPKHQKDVFETKLKAQHHLAIANISGYYAQKLMNKHLKNKGLL